MKILVTSGGTKVPIDKVRDITNMSTGTFGAKIGTEFLRAGHEVVFMKAKNSKSPVLRTVDMTKNFNFDSFKSWVEDVASWKNLYNEYEYSTYEQYAEMLKFVIGVEMPDIIVLAAAVSDYGVENYFDGKMRSNDLFTIKLTQVPKLISRVKEWSTTMKPNSKLVGFKMLVNSKHTDLIAAAKRSVDENGCDMVVANDLEDIRNNNHRLYLVKKETGNYVINQFNADQDDSNYLAKVVVKESLAL